MNKIDWNEIWKGYYEDTSSGRATREENRKFWDDFAPRFRKKTEDGQVDPYIETFYEYSGFRKGETIFDMGCASGTLAIPYAKRGHEIVAADFSPEMLKHLMFGAKEEGVEDRIHPIQLDWNEDWSAKDLPVCDVAISSRSFVPKDMRDAIGKLESVAKRKICLGLWDMPSAHYNRQVARAIGYDRPGMGMYAYILGELMERDLLPELRFIKNTAFRHDRYESIEQAVEQLAEGFYYGQPDGISDAQYEKLQTHCREHLVYEEDDRGGCYRLDHDRISTAAHVSWELPKRE